MSGNKPSQDQPKNKLALYSPAVDLTRKALGQRLSKSNTRRCDKCYKRGTEVKLKSCMRCRSALYCSKQCQATHWNEHKLYCVESDYHAALVKMDKFNATILHSPFSSILEPPYYPPPNMTWIQFDQCIDKWKYFHLRTLMAATIHALELPRNWKRAISHVVFIRVKWREDNTEIGKYFRLVETQIITQEAARVLSEASIDALKALQKGNEAREGSIVGLLLECLPMKGIHTVPIASVRKQTISKLPWLENWEKIMSDRFDNGTTF